MNDLLKLSDDDLAKLGAQRAKTAPPGLYQPSVEATYSSAAMLGADSLPAEYSQKVLDILAHIQIFNDARENGLFYQRLTFDSNLKDDNYKKVLQNADITENELSKRARIIVDKITALEKR